MTDETQSGAAESVPDRPADSTGTGVPPSGTDLAYYATRPSAALDEVKLQADYCVRSMISFWRFRKLGGGKSPDGEPPRLNHGGESGIHYVSDHPEVRLLSLSVVFLLVIFESAANAYFFAQESQFGLFGGVFQAAAVSLANVATSYFIIGYWGLRHAAMPAGRDFRRNTIRGFGIFAVLFGVIMVLLVNLSAAHYRNILDLRGLPEASLEVLKSEGTLITFPRFLVDTEVCQAVLNSEIGTTIGSAATNAMCRPFALHSLDAMVLFALGLAISALAAFEGRKADSAFPGLSDAARHFEGSRRDLQDALDDYYDGYEDVFEDIQEDFGGKPLGGPAKVQLRQMMDAAVADYRAILETASELLADEFDVDQDVVDLIRKGAANREPTP